MAAVPRICVYRTVTEKLTTRVHSTFADASNKIRDPSELWTDSRVATHKGMGKAATEKSECYRMLSFVGEHLKLIGEDRTDHRQSSHHDELCRQ